MVVGAVLLADGLDEGACLAQVVARQAREEMVLHLARGRGRVGARVRIRARVRVRVRVRIRVRVRVRVRVRARGRGGAPPGIAARYLTLTTLALTLPTWNCSPICTQSSSGGVHTFIVVRSCILYLAGVQRAGG